MLCQNLRCGVASAKAWLNDSEIIRPVIEHLLSFEARRGEAKAVVSMTCGWVRAVRLLIKEMHDDLWFVSLMDYALGYFDLGTRVLEPIKNPCDKSVTHVNGTFCPSLRAGPNRIGRGEWI